MRNRLRFWKYPIFIVMLLLVVAAFTLVYALSDTAVAPYEHVETPEPVVNETPEPPDTTVVSDAPDEPEVEPEEEEPFLYPADVGYVTINMDISDIHRGYLILVNYNHEYSIPDDLDLVNIIEARTTSFRVQSESFRLARSIMKPLDEMMDAFISTTRINSVSIISAFRNYDYQQRVLNNYIARVGRREALRWASLPGHSEHHTGLAFDFGIISGGVRSTFTGTGSTSWFRQNSYNYGFILRFPQNKTHITRTSYEPWHYRFVGLPHSYIMFQNNWCFEEYIELLRDYTFEEPFEAEFDDVLYEIYFSDDTEIKLPLNSEFDISGNNVDGFIITIVRQEYDPSEVIDVSI